MIYFTERWRKICNLKRDDILAKKNILLWWVDYE